MSKWAFLIAVAAAVIGCAGRGTPGTGTTNGGVTGGAGESRAVVALPNTPALVNISYLTGQGRAIGSPTAVIRRVVLEDEIGVIETLLNPERHMQLDGYTHHIISLNAPVPVPLHSRLFQEFILEVQQLRIDQGFGNFITIDGQFGQPVLREIFTNFELRAFPGRHHGVAIFLDDAMLNANDGFDGVDFDRELFEQANENPATGLIQGFLSDYVMFDISNVANKPVMTNGTPVSRVYFSGDAIALSAAPPSGGVNAPFEVLTPIGSREGLFSAPQFGFPGTYTLMQLDPRDLTNVRRVTALEGIWRGYTEVIQELGPVEFITFPNSDDDNFQDMVIVIRNASGQIINMYFGSVDFTDGTWEAFPIQNVTPGTIAGELRGTVSNFRGRQGESVAVNGQGAEAVRSGTFTVTQGGPVAGLTATGRFIVFRL